MGETARAREFVKLLKLDRGLQLQDGNFNPTEPLVDGDKIDIKEY
ncbi:13612_t:CDS:1, partial [Racocetra fulgida]